MDKGPDSAHVAFYAQEVIAKGWSREMFLTPRAYSKAAAFDDPYTPVATAIDIKAKYDAKCGAPSVGSPKVFFKYFYINTATGKKSGEVLAQAKLSE